MENKTYDIVRAANLHPSSNKVATLTCGRKGKTTYANLEFDNRADALVFCERINATCFPAFCDRPNDFNIEVALRFQTGKSVVAHYDLHDATAPLDF